MELTLKFKKFIILTQGNKYKVININNNETIKDNLSFEEANDLEETLNK